MNGPKRVQYLLLSFFLLSLFIHSAEPPIVLTDGPYIFWKGKQATISYIVEGKIYHQQIDTTGQQEVTIHCPELNQNLIISPQPPLIESPEYQHVSKIFAVSDLHGQYSSLCSILKDHGVIDTQNQWHWGNGHLVIVGDIFDRGPQVTESLWLIHQLSRQARQQGGGVHMVLGNHELLVLQGDLRYPHEKYQQIAKDFFHTEINLLYGPNSELGRWLRTCPTLLKINDILFVHGGIHPLLIQKKETITSINSTIRNHIDTPRDVIKNDPYLNSLFRNQSPLWYRGFLMERNEDKLISKKQVRQIETYFHINHIVVGHTTLQQIYALFGKRIIGVDAGFKTGVRGEGLLIKRNHLYRALPKGILLPLKNTKHNRIRLED